MGGDQDKTVNAEAEHDQIRDTSETTTQFHQQSIAEGDEKEEKIMEDEELSQAHSALIDLKKVSRAVSDYDPSAEVEHNIVTLLRHRIEKLQEDAQFEQNVKDAILARLPEAEFSELIRILDTVQAHANASTGVLLAPFVPKAGERVPLLDDKKVQKASESNISEESRSEDLQAIAELGRAIRLLKEKKRLDQEKSQG